MMPYINSARQVIIDTCHLVLIFVCLLVLVDILGSVTWIYLRRYVTQITFMTFLATSVHLYFSSLVIAKYTVSIYLNLDQSPGNSDTILVLPKY